jgi:hypothetical protein
MSKLAIKVKQLKEDDFPKQEGGVGRSRQPSDFDPIVVKAYESGKPQLVEFATAEEASNLNRELTRSLQYHDKGADRRLRNSDNTDKYSGEGPGALVFRVRDKQESGPRGPRVAAGDPEGEAAVADELAGANA